MGELADGCQKRSNEVNKVPGTHLMQKSMIKKCKSIHCGQASLPGGQLVECLGNPSLESGCKICTTHKLVLGCRNEVEIPWAYLDLLDLPGILLLHSVSQCGGEQIAAVGYAWLCFGLIDVGIVYQPVLTLLVSPEITIYDLESIQLRQDGCNLFDVRRRLHLSCRCWG